MGRQSCDDKSWYFLQNQKIPQKELLVFMNIGSVVRPIRFQYRRAGKSSVVLVQVALLQMYVFVVICLFV